MFLIAVDGGGTKTTVVLADEKGNIFSTKKGGPANWRNVGVSASAKEVFQTIKKAKGRRKIALSYIALAGIEEEKKSEKKEFIHLLKEEGLEGDVIVDSDHLAAFRAGTEKKEGVVMICGTGSIACGWKKGKKKRASGWGFFSDEGSAFYVGIEGYRAVQKSFDKRGEKTKIKDILLKEKKIKTPEEVNKLVYSSFQSTVPSFAKIVNKAGEEKDIVAISILEKAAKEAAVSAKTVVREMNFCSEFPLVLSGGMFKSEVFFSVFKKEVLQSFPKAKVIFAQDPVKGAVLLVVGELKKRKNGS